MGRNELQHLMRHSGPTVGAAGQHLEHLQRVIRSVDHLLPHVSPEVEQRFDPTPDGSQLEICRGGTSQLDDSSWQFYQFREAVE